MKLENQVASLELSKQLNKLLGDKAPESLWYWFSDDKKIKDKKWQFLELELARKKRLYPNCEKIPAYTVAESGEMIKKYQMPSYDGKTDKDWCFIGENGKKYLLEVDTEANARAKMLIYLLGKIIY